MLRGRRKLFWVAILVVCFLALFSSQDENVSLAQSGTETPTSLTFKFQPVDNNPILQPGAAGAWDAVSVRFPQVVFYKGKYYLFYGTFQTMTDPVSIGFAQSSDGIHWTKF